jgi:transcriptional regulator with XRE-family HTH domain
MSQEKLAALLGVRQNHISMIESGNVQNVRMDLLAKLARALHVKTDYFFGFVDLEHADATYAEHLPQASGAEESEALRDLRFRRREKVSA